MLTPSNRVLAHTVPLERRPIFSAIIDGGYSVASSYGPLLGGAIISRLSWRWCFLINTPPGVVCTLTILLAYEDRYIPARGADRLKTQIARLDLVATLLYALTITCLVLPLQWGGSTFPWSSGQVIALFVLFGVFLAVFISNQLWRGDCDAAATHRPKQRNDWCSCLCILRWWHCQCFRVLRESSKRPYLRSR
jgi:MFS family permease